MHIFYNFFFFLFDVIIPCCDVDTPLLYKSVQGIRENVLDGVGTIYLVGTERLEQISKNLNCEYVNEINFMSFSKECLINCSLARCGWFFQQLIKFSGDNLAKTDDFLIFDADHILLKPHKFVENGKYIFYMTDEFHEPYFATIKKLLGETYTKKVKNSFISDKMVLNKKILNEMKTDIAKRSKFPWIKSIVKSYPKGEFSGFSEFETYGTYIFDNYSDLVETKNANRKLLFDGDISYSSFQEIKDKYSDYNSITQGKSCSF